MMINEPEAQPIPGVPRPFGKSVRAQKKLGGKFPAPVLLTLTAISLTKAHELRASTWKMPITGSIPQTEAELLRVALGDAPGGDARLVSDTLDGIIFDAPSYYTLVIDVPNWNFCGEGVYASYDPFVFYYEKEETIDGRIEVARKQPNWSFFNAEMIEVGGSNAVRCIDFCKEPGTEDDLPPKARSPFGFNIYLAVPIAGRQASDGRSIVIIDPTGENKGPNG